MAFYHKQENDGCSGALLVFANLDAPDTIFDLAAGQTQALNGIGCRQTLVCIKGRVWITQQGDPLDYVLVPGSAFIITHPGMVLVEAMEPARIGCIQSLGTRCRKRPAHAGTDG